MGESAKTGVGLVQHSSAHSVEDTVQKLQALLEARSITLFALIDHSGEAEKVGLHMPPTKLVVFGNPKGGTPLMLAAPSIAIDLPMKILIAEDGQGKVWVSYNSPAYLTERHGLPVEMRQSLALVELLAVAVTG